MGEWLKKLTGFAAALAVVYALLALLARPAPDHPYFNRAGGRPWVIAHQGGDGLWPGNTMFAFERAAAMGVDVLEMDLHSTADGVLVLMHDSTVDRTTDGTGPVNGLTLQALQALDAGYHWSPEGGQTHPYRGRGITVPTLAELFAALPGRHMNIEIKQTEPSLAAPLCKLIRDHGMEGRVLVASFKAVALDQFRRECPEVATSASEGEVRTFFVMNLLFVGAAYSPAGHALQVPEYSGRLHVLTPRFVAGAQARNLEVHAWTINEAADMQRMLALGADGIITDYPDRLMALLGR